MIYLHGFTLIFMLPSTVIGYVSLQLPSQVNTFKGNPAHLSVLDCSRSSKFGNSASWLRRLFISEITASLEGSLSSSRVILSWRYSSSSARWGILSSLAFSSSSSGFLMISEKNSAMRRTWPEVDAKRKWWNLVRKQYRYFMLHKMIIHSELPNQFNGLSGSLGFQLSPLLDC